MAPELADDGSVGVNGKSPRVLVRPSKPLSTAVALATVKTEVADRAVYGDAATCEAVIVVEPAPTTTTTPVELSIVATLVSELVKLNAPLLGDDGGAMVNWASPKVFAGATNDPKLGVAEAMVKVAVMLDDTYKRFAV